MDTWATGVAASFEYRLCRPTSNPAGQLITRAHPPLPPPPRPPPGPSAPHVRAISGPASARSDAFPLASPSLALPAPAHRPVRAPARRPSGPASAAAGPPPSPPGRARRSQRRRPHQYRCRRRGARPAARRPRPPPVAPTWRRHRRRRSPPRVHAISLPHVVTAAPIVHLLVDVHRPAAAASASAAAAAGHDARQPAAARLRRLPDRALHRGEALPELLHVRRQDVQRQALGVGEGGAREVVGEAEEVGVGAAEEAEEVGRTGYGGSAEVLVMASWWREETVRRLTPPRAGGPRRCRSSCCPGHTPPRTALRSRWSRVAPLICANAAR
jgi:hypothetical protein